MSLETAPERRRRGALLRLAPSYAIMIVVVLVTLYPLLWMLFGALKSPGEFYQNIWGLPEAWAWQNFVAAWRRADLGQKYLNSIIVTLGTLIVAVPLTSMAAYALATMRFAGRRIVYAYLLLGIMVPFGVTAIPTFTVVTAVGLLDTRLGLILVYAAQSLSFGIFLMYAFFETIPRELEDAARIDGCSRIGAFFRVILPLTVPGLVTQVIFIGITAWNEYFMASILIHDETLETLPLGLVTFTGRYVTNYPELFAALSLVTVPVIALYLAAQRHFISGLTAGAVKG